MYGKVHADLNDDFAACRRTILQIGSDPRSPADQYCLGLSHAFALNHKKDRAQAAKWFRKAADQNHPAAQAVLGYLYEGGDGVKADPAEAAKWYRKAAEQNHTDGLFNLGRAYEQGIGLSKDLAQARTFYSKAAAAGSRDAQQALANLGKGPEPVPPGQAQFDEGVRLYKAKDYAGAAKVFQKLAEQGNPKAQLQIGYQYEFGEGVRQSHDEAVFLRRLFLRTLVLLDAALEPRTAGRLVDAVGDGARTVLIKSLQSAQAVNHAVFIFLRSACFVFGRIGVGDLQHVGILEFAACEVDLLAATEGRDVAVRFLQPALSFDRGHGKILVRQKYIV